MKLVQMQKPVIQELKVGTIFCVSLGKDKKYYLLSDVATWSLCGHIKTMLYYELIIDSDIKRIKKIKNLPIFTQYNQFILRHGKAHAIYNVRIHTAYKDDTKISSTSFQKIPNLSQCRCGN